MAVGGRTLLRLLIVLAIGALLAPSGGWAADPTASPPAPSAASPAPRGTPESMGTPGSARAASAETSPCGTPVGPGPIILPRAGTIYATITQVEAAVDSDWGLEAPEHRQLVANIRDGGQWGPDLLVGTFPAGTPLVFYTYTPHWGTTHLSTSTFAQMRPDGPDAWLVCIEDSPDNQDYDEPAARIYYGVGSHVEPVPSGMDTRHNGDDAGDPVQTFAGAFTYRHTDVAIGGSGPVPTFSRSYDSADTRVGMLGPGWTSEYDVRLRSPGDASGDILFVDARGVTDRYTRNPDDTFSPPPAVTRTLARGPGGTYVATERSKTTWQFGPSGALIAISNNTMAPTAPYVGLTSHLTYDTLNRTDFGGGSTPWRKMEPWHNVPDPRAAARSRGSTRLS